VTGDDGKAIVVMNRSVYLETEPTKTYVCKCYGRVEIVARHDPGIREKVRTFYHDKPRFVFGPGADETLEAAPVINHTDAELIMLESMVGRIPPFMRDKRGSRYDDDAGGDGY
jgi:hypothetical protein